VLGPDHVRDAAVGQPRVCKLMRCPITRREPMQDAREMCCGSKVPQGPSCQECWEFALWAPPPVSRRVRLWLVEDVRAEGYVCRCQGRGA